MANTIFVSAITSFITGLVAFYIQERRIRADLRTEFMAEKAAKSLLENINWKKRSFDEILKRLGGFEQDELRKILVRAGAVKFESSDGKEFWGLISRNTDEL